MIQRVFPDCALLSATLGTLLLTAGPARAGKTAADFRRGVGECASPAGTLVLCEGPGRPCRLLGPRSLIFDGDLLLALPGQSAAVNTAKGAVRLALLGQLPDGAEEGPRESAVRLNASNECDLDLTVERGRVLLQRRGSKGTVRVRVRFLTEVLTLELSEPDTVVALEVYSRWPAGAPFRKEAEADHRPLVDGLLFLVKGELTARLKKDSEQLLKGKLVYHWNSQRGAVGPLPLKELPTWTADPAPPLKKTVKNALVAFQKRLAKEGLPAALEEARRGKKAQLGALAAQAAGAIDDLPRLLQILDGAGQTQVRKAAVAALRHWSGRSAAHDVRLYEALVAQKYRPGQAEIVMELLHGFSPATVGRPETYGALIDYLGHDRMVVRELAAEHLYRLAPAGQAIAYDAARPAAERAQAQAAWRKLIPRGQLPPPARKGLEKGIAPSKPGKGG